MEREVIDAFDASGAFAGVNQVYELAGSAWQALPSSPPVNGQPAALTSSPCSSARTATVVSRSSVIGDATRAQSSSRVERVTASGVVEW